MIRNQSGHVHERYTKLNLETVMKASPYSDMVFGRVNDHINDAPVVKSEIPPVSHITSRIVLPSGEPLQGVFKPYISDLKYLAKNSSTEVKNNSVNCVVDLPGIVKGKLVIYPLGSYQLNRSLIKKDVRVHYISDTKTGDCVGVLTSVGGIATIELPDLGSDLSLPIQFHTDFDLSFS